MVLRWSLNFRRYSVYLSIIGVLTAASEISHWIRARVIFIEATQPHIDFLYSLMIAICVIQPHGCHLLATGKRFRILITPA